MARRFLVSQSESGPNVGRRPSLEDMAGQVKRPTGIELLEMNRSEWELRGWPNIFGPSSSVSRVETGPNAREERRSRGSPHGVATVSVLQFLG